MVHNFSWLWRRLGFSTRSPAGTALALSPSARATTRWSRCATSAQNASISSDSFTCALAIWTSFARWWKLVHSIFSYYCNICYSCTRTILLYNTTISFHIHTYVTSYMIQTCLKFSWNTQGPKRSISAGINAGWCRRACQGPQDFWPEWVLHFSVCLIIQCLYTRIIRMAFYVFFSSWC